METISSEPKIMTVAGGHQLTTKYLPPCKIYTISVCVPEILTETADLPCDIGHLTTDSGQHASGGDNN